MTVEPADKNITIIHTTPVHRLTSCEVKSCVFLRNKSIISSSSSSPLLSLVQVPAKLAINLSIHTQHTYDNGVDRTGRQGIKKNTAFT